MLVSISEHIKKVAALPSEEEQIAYLHKNMSLPLRKVLKFIYDTKNIKFLIPDTAPPWKKNGFFDLQGGLFKESRKLDIFIKNGGYDHMNQVKRETLFIRLLEEIDNADAEFLCEHMICQKPVEGLSFYTIMAAYPQDYN